MKLRHLVVAVLLAAPLAGCEFIVDPVRESSGSTTQGTQAATGSTAASSSTASSSTASSSSASASASSSSSTGSGSSSGSSASSSASSTSGSESSSGTASGSSGTSSSSSSSGSSGGSTGGQCEGPFGSTGNQIPCPGTATPPNGTADGGVVSDCPPPVTPPTAMGDWPLWPLPDSTSTCAASNTCPGTGTDADWWYPVEGFADGGTHTLTTLVVPATVHFIASTRTGIRWQSDDVATLSGAEVSGGCASTSSLASWNDSSIVPPPPSALVQLLDFGSGDGTLLPPAFADRTAGWHWAATAGDSAWAVNFTTGALSTQSGSSRYATRCITSATSSTTAPPGSFFLCSALGPANNLHVCGAHVQNSLSAPLTTGLQYLLADTDVDAATSWNHALEVCNQRGTDTSGAPAGTCGWRLPSYKELAALVNFSGQPTGTPIDSLTGAYWSSTDSPQDAGAAMAVTFAGQSGQGVLPASGGPLAKDVDGGARVLCVHDAH